MLVALDGNHREAWAVLRRSIDRGDVPTVPTVVTAQAWPDGHRQARLAQALGRCREEPLAPDLARRAGELCARSGTADVVDAVVVESARRRQDSIFTGDPDDLERLASHTDAPVVVVPIGRTR